MLKKLVVSSLMTLAVSSAFATGTTWEFGSKEIAYQNGNSLVVEADGIKLSVTAWASTADACVGGYDKKSKNDPDPCIEKANLQNYNGGLGIINVDEQKFDYGDYNDAGDKLANKDKPSDYYGQHAIDSKKNRGSKTDLDFEMVLLSFDHSVNITGLSKSWPTGDNSQFSALAHNSSTPFASFEGSTWEDIATNGAWDVVDNGSLKNDGYMTSLNSSTELFSQYWLVGAYNSVFGGSLTEGDDMFKLNGLQTVKYTPHTGSAVVNAPATIGMFAALIGMFILRRRKARV